MDNKLIFKQMLEWHKTSFDGVFNTMVMLQEQGEKMVEAQLSQAEWLPENGKDAIRNWINAYRDGRESFKKAVEDSYKYVEKYFENL